MLSWIAACDWPLMLPACPSAFGCQFERAHLPPLISLTWRRILSGASDSQHSRPSVLSVRSRYVASYAFLLSEWLGGLLGDITSPLHRGRWERFRTATD